MKIKKKTFFEFTIVYIVLYLRRLSIVLIAHCTGVLPL